MKYKKGNKVRVKPLEKLKKGNYIYGICKEMLGLAGQIVTIEKVDNDCYRLENNIYTWEDDMFSGLAEEAETSLPKELNINGLIYILKE